MDNRRGLEVQFISSIIFFFVESKLFSTDVESGGVFLQSFFLFSFFFFGTRKTRLQGGTMMLARRIEFRFEREHRSSRSIGCAARENGELAAQTKKKETKTGPFTIPVFVGRNYSNWHCITKQIGMQCPLQMMSLVIDPFQQCGIKDSVWKYFVRMNQRR